MFFNITFHDYRTHWYSSCVYLLQELSLQTRHDAKNMSMEQKLGVLMEYVKTHNRLPVCRYRTDTGFALGTFFKNIQYGRIKISDDQQKEIQNLCKNFIK